jgi:predicted transcriptional regulator
MQSSNLITVRVNSEIADRLQKFSTLTNRWQIKAIEEGIAAAERGEVKDFIEIRKYWKKKFEVNHN